MNSNFAKPALMGVYSMLIDKFYLGERDMNKTLYFGLASAVGSYASEWVVPVVNPLVKSIPSLSTGLYETKTLTDRIVEVGSSTATVYVLNKYILNNDNYKDEILLRMGVIAVADFASTYTLEYMNNKPLDFLH